jgi:ribosome-binding ATPase YchF (GTP1/OBG family)
MRFIPVKLLDVAGLVPGASEVRGHVGILAAKEDT